MSESKFKVGETVSIARHWEHGIRSVGIITAYESNGDELRYTVEVQEMPFSTRERVFTESDLTLAMSQRYANHDGALVLLNLSVNSTEPDRDRFLLRETIAETTAGWSEAELRQMIYLVAGLHRGLEK